jgi:hypothetical protein
MDFSAANLESLSIKQKIAFPNGERVPDGIGIRTEDRTC